MYKGLQFGVRGRPRVVSCFKRLLSWTRPGKALSIAAGAIVCFWRGLRRWVGIGRPSKCSPPWNNPWVAGCDSGPWATLHGSASWVLVAAFDDIGVVRRDDLLSVVRANRPSPWLVSILSLSIVHTECAAMPVRGSAFWVPVFGVDDSFKLVTASTSPIWVAHGLVRGIGIVMGCFGDHGCSCRRNPVQT